MDGEGGPGYSDLGGKGGVLYLTVPKTLPAALCLFANLYDVLVIFGFLFCSVMV